MCRSLRILLIALACLAAGFAAGSSLAQTGLPPDSTGFAVLPADSAQGRVLLSGERFGLAGSASGALMLEARYPAPRNLNLFLRPPSTPPSRLDLVFHGVGVGANTAGFLGAMGNAIGLWDEHTAWAMIAAGASLGAIWKGASPGPTP
jgi:hypothetical protein